MGGMQVNDANDLISFMDGLKVWAIANNDQETHSAIDAAERAGETASSLIIEYGKVLKLINPWKSRFPQMYQENIERAIRVTEETISPS